MAIVLCRADFFASFVASQGDQGDKFYLVYTGQGFGKPPLQQALLSSVGVSCSRDVVLMHV